MGYFFFIIQFSVLYNIMNFELISSSNCSRYRECAVRISLLPQFNVTLSVSLTHLHLDQDYVEFSLAFIYQRFTDKIEIRLLSHHYVVPYMLVRGKYICFECKYADKQIFTS